MISCAGPGTVREIALESGRLSAVQIAPSASQSVVAASASSRSRLDVGINLIAHKSLRFLPSSSLTCHRVSMSPSTTVRAWSRRVRALMFTGSLNNTRTTNFRPSPEWPGGYFSHSAVSLGAAGRSRPSRVFPGCLSITGGPLAPVIVPSFSVMLSASKAMLRTGLWASVTVWAKTSVELPDPLA